MADQESAHEETPYGPRYTPTYSPRAITLSPSTAHALSATPNESIEAPKAEETTDNLKGTTETGTSRLKSDIWKHFKRSKLIEKTRPNEIIVSKCWEENQKMEQNTYEGIKIFVFSTRLN